MTTDTLKQLYRVPLFSGPRGPEASFVFCFSPDLTPDQFLHDSFNFLPRETDRRGAESGSGTSSPGQRAS